MKRVLMFLLTAFIGYPCMAQQRVDLEKLTFKEDPGGIIKKHKKAADRAEPLTSLPSYTTYEVSEFNFGPIPLTEHCFVSLLLNSTVEKKMVGLIVGFQTIAESKAINTYIFKHYGKPVTLQTEKQLMDSNNKPYPSGSAYLWRNIRPGVSLVLSKSYEFQNDKLVEGTDLLFINNNAKPAYKTYFKTVLERVIKTYTP